MAVAMDLPDETSPWGRCDMKEKQLLKHIHTVCYFIELFPPQYLIGLLCVHHWLSNITHVFQYTSQRQAGC